MNTGSLLRSYFQTLAFGLVFAAVFPSCLSGQTFYGGIRGRVEDPAGGAVASAKVTILDVATNVGRSTLTNEQGEYVFSAVYPATYKLVTEVPGFKRFEHSGIIIETQSALTLDVKLEVGSVNESVQVTAEVPLIESGKADTGQVLDSQKLTDLPNLGRNPWLMTKVSAGVINVGDPRFNRMQDQSGSSQISIAGGPNRGNNYLIDGVPITDTRNRAVIVPTLEAMQEVKMQVHTYDAEMGRMAGGMFNSYMKSGTNDLHGAAFSYFRPTDFYANNFFNNRNGIERPDLPYKNYGGAFGGPFWLPHIYNGKNRTFFWVAGEAYRMKSQDSASFAVPTAIERVGDFSVSRNADGSLRQIFDPLASQPDGKGGVVRTPLAGNVIPASRINPIGRNLAAFYPMPNKATPSYGINNFAEGVVLTDRADQTTAKVDHTLFSWWRISGAYLHYGSREPGHQWWGTVATPEGWTLLRNVDATVVNNTLTPNPTTVVNIRYGFNRFPNDQPTRSRGFDVTTLGFSPSYAALAQRPRFPLIGMQYLSRLGADDTEFSQFWSSRNLLGSVSKFMGRHNLKMGADYRVLHLDFITFGYTTGNFSFDEGFTRQFPFTPNGTGSDLASLLLGTPAGGGMPFDSKFFTFVRYYSGYFHDDFRVNPRLTLNLGLRYEYETGLQEKSNNFSVGFDRNALNPIAANVSGVTIPDLAPGVTGVLAKGGLQFAGVNGNRTQNGTDLKYKLGPRLGVAWQVNEATTLRGGYGIFWAPTSTGEDANSIGAWGYSVNTSYIASNDGGVTPAGTLSNPFPSGVARPVGNRLGFLTQLGDSVSFVDPNKRGGLVHQFSFDVQREIPGKIAVSLGYVGSRSRHLQRAGSGSGGGFNINELEPRFYGLGEKLFDAVDNPFFNRGGAGIIGSPKVTRAQLLLTYPEFGSVVLIGDSNARSRYDSLVVKAQKRFTHGLTFLSTWTWSKNLTSAFYDDSTINCCGGYQTVYDLGREYSLAIIHSPHRFTSTVSYDLPFGKGRAFLHANKYVDCALGGWQINAVIVARTGFPQTITQNNQLNGILGAGAQRPNATGVSPATSGSVTDRLDLYFNPNAFSQAPRFTFGNISRTIPVLGPGQNSWDVSVFKTLSVAEKWKVQFRAEAINFLNHPLFYGPNTNWGSPNFGQITSQADFARFVQVGFRFFF